MNFFILVGGSPRTTGDLAFVARTAEGGRSVGRTWAKIKLANGKAAFGDRHLPFCLPGPSATKRTAKVAAQHSK